MMRPDRRLELRWNQTLKVGDTDIDGWEAIKMSAGAECEVAVAARSVSTLEFGGGVRLPGPRVGDQVGVGHPGPALRAGVGRDGAGRPR